MGFSQLRSNPIVCVVFQEPDGDDKQSDTSHSEKAPFEPTTVSNNSPKSEQSWGSSETTSGMKLDPPPGTTCDICLKTFACRSALEIHYRSHTKHRPFKCDLCDKAFTTRGNMKQHILTHKSDDLQWSGGEKQIIQPPLPSPPNSTSELSQNIDEMKKSGGRHQCSVCLKYFSSASAVQIHFRTHTGDRPFKCNVCGKAFTTKGNLKVHMGTHMWNGSTHISSGKPDIPDSLEHRIDRPEEEANSVSSPRTSIMNNNHFGWNPFNQSPLMKAPFLGNHAAVMANYHGMFVPPGGLQPPGIEEQRKPWDWQLTCHICNKELPSAAALELHMKIHLVSESGTSKPVPASQPVLSTYVFLGIFL